MTLEAASLGNFPVEGAQPLRPVDLQQFFQLLKKDHAVLEKLSAEDQLSFKKAALRSEAIRKMPIGIRGAREAVFSHQAKGEAIPGVLKEYKPLDPAWAREEERALQNWKPVHHDAVRDLLRNHESGERQRTTDERDVAKTLDDNAAAIAAQDGLHTARGAVHDPQGHEARSSGGVPSSVDEDAHTIRNLRAPQAPNEDGRSVEDKPRMSTRDPNERIPPSSGPDIASLLSKLVEEQGLVDAPGPVTLGEENARGAAPAGATPAAAATPNPQALLETLQAARRRIASIAETSGLEAQRGAGLHERAGAFALPPQRPRKGLLAARTGAPSRVDVPSAYRRSLSAMDRHVQDIVQQITHNPVWVAAEYIERTSTLKSASDFPPSAAELREQPELAAAVKELTAARTLYADDVGAHARAQQRLAAHQSRPGWMRAAQNLVLNTEHKLRQQALDTSMRVLESSREVRSREQEAKALFASHLETTNELTKEQRGMAREERDAIERPLREAVLERHRAEEALANRPAPERAIDAPERAALRYECTVKVDGFAFASLKGDDGTRYLLDRTEYRLDGEKLRTGHVLQVTRDEHQSRHVSIAQRPTAPAPTPERARAMSR